MKTKFEVSFDGKYACTIEANDSMEVYYKLRKSRSFKQQLNIVNTRTGENLMLARATTTKDAASTTQSAVALKGRDL